MIYAFNAAHGRQEVLVCKVLILVVDDEPLVRDGLASLLVAFGHQVIEARDGIEALQLYQALCCVVSLVLMDIDMPRLDGIEAAQVIKAFDPSAKVILISGNTAQLPAEARADAFLPKPFRGKDLALVIRQVLGDSSAGILELPGAGERAV